VTESERERRKGTKKGKRRKEEFSPNQKGISGKFWRERQMNREPPGEKK
jgi:hypothetical protein